MQFGVVNETEGVYMHTTVDEARTMYFALRQYSDQITKDIKRAVKRQDGTMHEDLMFLGEMLNKVDGLLYEMVENHSREEKARVLRIMDCV